MSQSQVMATHGQRGPPGIWLQSVSHGSNRGNDAANSIGGALPSHSVQKPMQWEDLCCGGYCLPEEMENWGPDCLFSLQSSQHIVQRVQVLASDSWPHWRSPIQTTILGADLAPSVWGSWVCMIGLPLSDPCQVTSPPFHRVGKLRY